MQGVPRAPLWPFLLPPASPPQSPCDEGRRPSALIMSHLMSPFNALQAAWLRVALSPRRGPCAVPLSPRGWQRGPRAEPPYPGTCPWGTERGFLCPCCITDVFALPLLAGRLHRPPLPRHARKAPGEIQQQVRAARGHPESWCRGGCPAATMRRTKGTCRTLPLSPRDSPEEVPWCSADLGGQVGDRQGTRRARPGAGARHSGALRAPSGPRQRGRLLILGHAPSYVHSRFIISAGFQDGQEQAGQRGQGRQQVAARSCCAQGVWKWHDSSRSRGL